MAMNDDEIKRVNDLYSQLDVMTTKYNQSLEDIRKLTNKITDYADALVKKCGCKDGNSKKK